MTARRTLKTLETLARARDFELNEMRREAAAAMDRLERAQAAMVGVAAALKSEAESVVGEPTMLAAYARYAARARERLTALGAACETLAADVDQADERVLEAYRGLKQIEEAAQAKRAEIEEEEARKERAAADDQAAIRAIRARA